MILQAADTFVEAANNFGDTREGAGAGPLALAVVSLLAIATVLLWRNMSKRIKRLPAEFPREQADSATPAPAATPAAATATADETPAPTDQSSTTER